MFRRNDRPQQQQQPAAKATAPSSKAAAAPPQNRRQHSLGAIPSSAGGIPPSTAGTSSSVGVGIPAIASSSSSSGFCSSTSKQQQQQQPMYIQESTTTTTTTKLVLNQQQQQQPPSAGSRGGGGGEQRSPRRPLLSREALGLGPSPTLPKMAARPAPLLDHPMAAAAASAEPSASSASSASSAAASASMSLASSSRMSMMSSASSSSSTATGSTLLAGPASGGRAASMLLLNFDLSGSPSQFLASSSMAGGGASNASPVPSPQWRLPAGGPSAGGGTAGPGGGGGGGSVGRTMPKSALLMSRLSSSQALLKSGAATSLDGSAAAGSSSYSSMERRSPAAGSSSTSSGGGGVAGAVGGVGSGVAGAGGGEDLQPPLLVPASAKAVSAVASAAAALVTASASSRDQPPATAGAFPAVPSASSALPMDYPVSSASAGGGQQSAAASSSAADAAAAHHHQLIPTVASNDNGCRKDEAIMEEQPMEKQPTREQTSTSTTTTTMMMMMSAEEGTIQVGDEAGCTDDGGAITATTGRRAAAAESRATADGCFFNFEDIFIEQRSGEGVEEAKKEEATKEEATIEEAAKEATTKEEAEQQKGEEDPMFRWTEVGEQQQLEERNANELEEDGEKRRDQGEADEKTGGGRSGRRIEENGEQMAQGREASPEEAKAEDEEEANVANEAKTVTIEEMAEMEMAAEGRADDDELASTSCQKPSPLPTLPCADTETPAENLSEKMLKMEIEEEEVMRRDESSKRIDESSREGKTIGEGKTVDEEQRVNEERRRKTMEDEQMKEEMEEMRRRPPKEDDGHIINNIEERDEASKRESPLLVADAKVHVQQLEADSAGQLAAFHVMPSQVSSENCFHSLARPLQTEGNANASGREEEPNNAAEEDRLNLEEAENHMEEQAKLPPVELRNQIPLIEERRELDEENRERGSRSAEKSEDNKQKEEEEMKSKPEETNDEMNMEVKMEKKKEVKEPADQRWSIEDQDRQNQLTTTTPNTTEMLPADEPRKKQLEEELENQPSVAAATEEEMTSAADQSTAQNIRTSVHEEALTRRVPDQPPTLRPRSSSAAAAGPTAKTKSAAAVESAKRGGQKRVGGAIGKRRSGVAPPPLPPIPAGGLSGGLLLDRRQQSPMGSPASALASGSPQASPSASSLLSASSSAAMLAASSSCRTSSFASSSAATATDARTAALGLGGDNCSLAASSPMPGCSSAGSHRLIERLRIGGMQLRNLRCSSCPQPATGDSQLVIAVRLDGREVFRTGAAQIQAAGGTAAIGEQLSLDELAPPQQQRHHFQQLQLNLLELVDGARQQRLMGRLKLSRRELIELTDSQQQQPEQQQQQDHWLPISRVRPPLGSGGGGGNSSSNEQMLLGSLCVDFGWDQHSKVLTLSVLDLTVWTLAGGTRENPLERHSRVDGRLHLKVRVAFGRSAFTGMQKIRLSERRGLEQARFDCSRFFAPLPSTGSGALASSSSLHPQAPATPQSPRFFPADHQQQQQQQQQQSAHEWLSGVSACSSPAGTPSCWTAGPKGGAAAGGNRHNTSRHFHFPPPSPGGGGAGQRHGTTTMASAGGIGTTAAAGARSGGSGNGVATATAREEPRVFIKLYGQQQPNSGGAGGGVQDSHSGSVRIGLDPERMQPRDGFRGPNWFNIFANLNMGKHSHQQHQHFQLHQEQQPKTAENNLGEIRFKLWYNMDEVLPLAHYEPLYLNLTHSLNSPHFSQSLLSLIQCLPIDVENLAKPLMKIFIHSKQIRPFFRLICSDHVASCSDVNTLFRSQSLASKVMYEMMKFVGHRYLVSSLKPLIDLIFAERKPCEIDPSKLKPGESLEHNFRNITVYAELAFSRVVDSCRRCPQALRELFAELRSVVEHFFPGREDVARLALSSFLIMRFFAAAILNPKLFALKLETPDVDVSRTLVLVSKILQRLANCVVSAHPLTTKELWLAPVLQRFSDDAHKAAMVNFLDQVSAQPSEGRDFHNHHHRQQGGKDQQGGQGDGRGEHDEEDGDILYNNENAFPPSTPTFCEPTVLKSGYLVERRFGPVKKRASFKNFIHPKRRLVVLTESALNWQKTSSKEAANSFAASFTAGIGGGGTLGRTGNQQQQPPTTTAMTTDGGQQQQQQLHFLFPSSVQQQQQQQTTGTATTAEPRSQIPLADVTSVGASPEAKNSFRVATVNTEVHFQASNEADMNEWIILIQKQQRLYLMSMCRPPAPAAAADFSAQMSEVDIERELHAVYSQLAAHLDTLCAHGWCCRPAGGCTHHNHQQQQQQHGQQQQQQQHGQQQQQ